MSLYPAICAEPEPLLWLAHFGRSCCCQPGSNRQRRAYAIGEGSDGAPEVGIVLLYTLEQSNSSLVGGYFVQRIVQFGQFLALVICIRDPAQIIETLGVCLSWRSPSNVAAAHSILDDSRLK